MEQTTGHSRAKKEELRKLKEGEIYVDEKGKAYRARKTVLPQESGGGPAGLGDPEDRSLRKIEIDSVIPEIMRKRLETVECRHTLADVIECLKSYGKNMLAPRYCRPILDIHNKCKLEKWEDPEFRKMMTEYYLEERRQYRLTGKVEMFRKLDEVKRRNEEKQKRT